MRIRTEPLGACAHAFRAMVLGALCALLGACSTGSGSAEAPTAALTPQGGAPGAQGPQTGRAPVKIALLLPLPFLSESTLEQLIAHSEQMMRSNWFRIPLTLLISKK